MDQRNVVMKDYKNSQWIKSCEESFAKQIYDITEDIVKKDGIRVIRLFGPSCSGKTTTARHLISFFRRFGKRAHVISIDDFFEDIRALCREWNTNLENITRGQAG